MENSQYEEYQAIVGSLPDLVFVLTETGKYDAILGGAGNDQYHNGQSLKNLNLFDVLPDAKAQLFLDTIHECLTSNQMVIFDYSLSATEVGTIQQESGPDGELRFEGRITPLKSLRDGEKAVVWVARNITERYNLEQQLRYQAQMDPLANVYNRRKLFECLDQAFVNFQQQAKSYCFILLDIDDFKQVNDRFGHQYGDQVVQSIASFCSSKLGPNDAFGRIGGDEFAIVIEGCISRAENLAAVLRDNDYAPDSLRGCPIGVSIGLCQFNDEHEDITQIYQQADNALYLAKKAGKGRYFTD